MENRTTTGGVEGRGDLLNHHSECRLQCAILDHIPSSITNEYVGSYQAGFVDGPDLRRTANSLEIRYQGPTHPLIIDLKAAYDNNDRTELRKIMDEKGFPGS